MALARADADQRRKAPATRPPKHPPNNGATDPVERARDPPLPSRTARAPAPSSGGHVLHDDRDEDGGGGVGDDDVDDDDDSTPLVSRHKSHQDGLRVTHNPAVGHGGPDTTPAAPPPPTHHHVEPPPAGTTGFPGWDGYGFDAVGRVASDSADFTPSAPIIDMLLTFEHPVDDSDDAHHVSNLGALLGKAINLVNDVFDSDSLNKGDSAFLRKHFVDLLRFRGLFAAEVQIGKQQGCYALSLPFATIAGTVEELKLEMPLSGRVFTDVHGWWAQQEDFISAHFSTDNNTVFSFAGFEKLGPSQKNGFVADTCHPAMWRKLERPDRERAFRTRIRQTCAVKVVGDVRIVPRRVSTLVLLVQYTDGNRDLVLALDHWRDSRQSVAGPRTSVSTLDAAATRLPPLNRHRPGSTKSIHSTNSFTGDDVVFNVTAQGQGRNTLVRTLDFSAVNAIWNPLPTDADKGEINTDLFILPATTVFKLEQINVGRTHPAFDRGVTEDGSTRAAFSDFESNYRYRLVLVKEDGSYYRREELAEKWVVIQHYTTEYVSEDAVYTSDPPYSWGAYLPSMMQQNKESEPTNSEPDPIYPRLPYIAIAHALEQYGVSGVLVNTAEDDHVNAANTVAFAARPGNCGVAKGPGAHYAVQCWYDSQKKSALPCGNSTQRHLTICHERIKELKKAMGSATTHAQKAVYKTLKREMRQREHLLFRKLQNEKRRLRTGETDHIEEVPAYGYYVDEGEPTEGPRSLKPMCIHCAAMYGCTQASATQQAAPPRRVAVPTTDPNVPLYVASRSLPLSRWPRLI